MVLKGSVAKTRKSHFLINYARKKAIGTKILNFVPNYNEPWKMKIDPGHVLTIINKNNYFRMSR